MRALRHSGEGRNPWTAQRPSGTTATRTVTMGPGLRRDDEQGAWLRRITMLSALALPLAGCGAATGLKPAEGRSLPVAPAGARATPTPAELLTPTVQQRPQRSDELLRNSEERRSDDFDLPPQG